MESFRQNMAFQSGFYPLSTTPSPTNVVERMKGACHLLVSAVLGTIISANLIFFFALVGTLLGAFTGALIGQETESGFIRGAEIGAFYGAVLSIEVFQSSIHLWRSDESCLVYLHDVVVSLLSGRLVRERIGPAIRQRISLLEIGGSTLTITGNNNTHGSENGESCSICLQDYQLGEIVRILPNCRHICLLHPLRVTTSSLIYRRTQYTISTSLLDFGYGIGVIQLLLPVNSIHLLQSSFGIPGRAHLPLFSSDYSL
ncbi:hypothetical protein HID58_054675 [Brassica napus]|uniref:NEP1-interacting protein 1 n=1 Tax=Brassica napus TaxID=3708 RepID=A0ABQ8AIC5_BRANA|nr:hypothetical protein HID58_054675 [Brassica napus]